MSSAPVIRADLEGKVAIVTGGNSGIGRAISKIFARQGAKVVIADLNRGDVVEEIQNSGGVAMFVRTDVSNPDQVKNLVEETVKAFGSIDVVCNDAGIELVKDTIDTSSEEWDKILDVNLKGPFLVSKYSLPYMRKNGKGSIVNISSQIGLVGLEGFSAYCASKGGLILLSKVMALENAKYNIRVNCVCPGVTDAPMTHREINLDPDPEKTKARFISKHPLGRMGKPEEIAEAVLFLASDRSSFITGDSLVVDGGYTIQ